MKSSAKTQAQGLWKDHSEAWNASGITQQAYCDQEGISYRSFVYQHNHWAWLAILSKTFIMFMITELCVKCSNLFN